MGSHHALKIRARPATACIPEPIEPRRLMAAVPSAAVVGDRLFLRGSDVADTSTVVKVLNDGCLPASRR